MKRGDPRGSATPLVAPACLLMLISPKAGADSATGGDDVPQGAGDQTSLALAAPIPHGDPKLSRKQAKSWKLTATWSDSVGFDSNPTRVEPVSGLSAHPSAFTTGLLGLGVVGVPWAQALEANLALGTKLHFSPKAKSADLLIGKADLSWRAQAAGLFLSMKGSYFESHEASQREGTDQKDTTKGSSPAPASLNFRISSLQAAAAASPAKNVEMQMGLMGTHFSYLPDQTLSYLGLTIFLHLSLTFELGKTVGAHQLTLSTGTAASWNRYPQWPEQRADLAPILDVELTYLGWCLLRMSYQLWSDFSSDPTWSSTRHSLSILASLALPWRIYGVAEATFQYLDYARGLLLYTPASSSNFARLDQEGRSSLLLSVQRRLSKHYSIQVRYLLYFDLTAPKTSGGQADRYIRHLVTLDILGKLL